MKKCVRQASKWCLPVMNSIQIALQCALPPIHMQFKSRRQYIAPTYTIRAQLRVRGSVRKCLCQTYKWPRCLTVMNYYIQIALQCAPPPILFLTEELGGHIQCSVYVYTGGIYCLLYCKDDTSSFQMKAPCKCGRTILK